VKTLDDLLAEGVQGRHVLVRADLNVPLDGDKITHQIDVSWNQGWTGADQVRFYKVEGNTLMITTAVNRNPRDGREGRAIAVFTRAP